MVLSQSPFAAKVLWKRRLVKVGTLGGPRRAHMDSRDLLRVTLVADFGAWVGTDKGFGLGLLVDKGRGLKGQGHVHLEVLVARVEGVLLLLLRGWLLLLLEKVRGREQVELWEGGSSEALGEFSHGRVGIEARYVFVSRGGVCGEGRVQDDCVAVFEICKGRVVADDEQ